MFEDYIVPEQCPACNSADGWKCIRLKKKGFSLGKAAVGGLLLGPVGLLGGTMGKKLWHIIVPTAVIPVSIKLYQLKDVDTAKTV